MTPKIKIFSRFTALTYRLAGFAGCLVGAAVCFFVSFLTLPLLALRYVALCLTSVQLQSFLLLDLQSLRSLSGMHIYFLPVLTFTRANQALEVCLSCSGEYNTVPYTLLLPYIQILDSPSLWVQ